MRLEFAEEMLPRAVAGRPEEGGRESTRRGRSSRWPDRAGPLAELIGNTPLYRLRRVVPGTVAANVYLKLEGYNPGGSIKDRTALGMILDAEERGLLRPGMSIVESSSGNTAIGLAMLAASRGYRVLGICDRHVPVGKLARIRAFGGDVVFLPESPEGVDTVELRIAVADHLASTSPEVIALGQFSNPANRRAHYLTTGPEIWDQLEGRVAGVVAAVGTCGTVSGVGRALKERDPGVRVFGAEPHGSVIFGGEPGRSLIQGGGLSFMPSLMDRSVVDGGVKVSDPDAARRVRELAQREGLLVGGTGGWVLDALLRLAGEFGPGDNLVGIVPDGGERYLDTLFHAGWLEEHGLGGGAADAPAARPLPEALAEEIDTIGCTVPGRPARPRWSFREICGYFGLPGLAELA